MQTDPERLRELIATYFDDVLVEARFPALPNYTPGKVRDSYDLPDGRRIIITTDRQSAFDQVLAAVPFKGQVLNGTAKFWFKATEDIVPNHTISHPDPNVMIVRRLRMLPVEVVVRDYLTGTTSTSIWPKYRDGERQMYGLTFPDGLRKHEKLPETIITPTTKATVGYHDEPVTPHEIVSRSLLSAIQWAEVREVALSLFARGREMALQRGLILVDTKYEFGYDEAGGLVLADEVHTPDSSRYWRFQTYREKFEAGEDPETLDKDFLRRWIVERCDPYNDVIPEIPKETLIDFSARYISLYETVTGTVFTPVRTTISVSERIRHCLSACV